MNPIQKRSPNLSKKNEQMRERGGVREREREREKERGKGRERERERERKRDLT